jgi:hypothetical protein
MSRCMIERIRDFMCMNPFQSARTSPLLKGSDVGFEHVATAQQ